MALAYFVKSIENQTVQVSDGSPSPNPVPLTLSQNYLNCAPFTTFDATNNSVWARTIPYTSMNSGSGGSVRWDRGNIFGTNQASSYIVEFDSTYIKVQQTSFEMSGSDSNSGISIGSVDIDEVDLSLTFLVPNHQGCHTGQIFRDLNTQCFFDSSTKIRAVRNTTTGDMRGRFVVVEALSEEWHVAHLDFTITPGNSETLVTVPQDAEWTRQSSNTFIITTFMSDEATNNPDEGFITVDWSGGQIRVRKGSTAATITGKIQLITSPAFEVQRGQIDFGIGVTNKTAGINAITTANSIVWGTAPYGSRTLGDSEDNEGMARILIQDSTTIAGQKNSSGIAHATDGAFQVIEFVEPPPSQWDLVIQDMTVATSTAQVEFIVSLIIQNLNVLTSTELTALIPYLNINNLDMNTTMGKMIFWEALETINTSILHEILKRTVDSKTLKRTISSKTLKRTLDQING